MSGPFAPNCIVIEVETGRPDRFLRFHPDKPDGNRWLHQLSEFDRALERDAIIDRYALPPSEEYTVQLVTVPAGVSLQIGDVAGTDGQSGGGDLVELLDRKSVPEAWINETTTLKAFLE